MDNCQSVKNVTDPFAGSFADHIAYNFGPRAALGRYMLAAEGRLSEIGIHLKRVDALEMVRLNRSSEDTWWRQVPVLDAEDFPPAGDELVCYIGYDRSGKPVTAVSTRLIDLGQATLKEEMESLRLFFGPRAEEMRRTVEFNITSPFAINLTGKIAYIGGFWVHPSVRGSGISAIVPKIVNYATIATWGVPVIISIVREVFFRPDIVDTYNVESAEPYFCFKTNGRLTWEGSLVWFSMPFLEKRLDLELAALLDRPSASDGRGQEALDAVDVRRVDQA